MAGPSIAELLSGGGNAYVRAERSPDNRYALIVASNEVRMSHWIDSGSLYAMPDEGLVAELGGAPWSADEVAWSPDGGSLTLRLRRYPGDMPAVMVRIDLNRLTAQTDGRDDTIPLAQLSAELEADYQRRGGKG